MKNHNRFYRVYNQVCNDAFKAYQQKQIDRCYNLIQTAASIAYFYNQFFFDEKIETLLKRNTELLFETNKLSENKDLLKNRIVFIDTNGVDNAGLTQQYIRALIALKYSFLYIYIDGKEDGTTENPATIKEIKEYEEAQIKIFKRKTKHSSKIKEVAQLIQQYAPSSILLHIMPWDVTSLAVIHRLKHIKSFNINLTDEAFWLGSSFFDYNIEFRNYGYTISLEQRKFKQDQLLYLPYYPIIPTQQEEFQGFPSNIPNDKIKIFTGGHFYKIFDRANYFFKLMDAILQANPNAIIIIAGYGNLKEFYKRIQTMSNKDRVYYVGFRKDINELFKQIDIYLSTYPISGALMSQYAAINGKPIIAFTEKELIDNKLEEIICHKIQHQISLNDIDSTIKYSKYLCSDKNIRVSEGKLLQEAITSKKDFDIKLKSILEGNTQESLEKDNINYEYIAQTYLALRKSIINDIIPLLIKLYRVKFLLKFYFLIPQIPLIITERLMKKIKDFQKLH